MEGHGKVVLGAWQDIKACMQPNDIRKSNFQYEMIVGDFHGTEIYSLDSIHRGTYAELEDLGEKIISSDIKTPSYRISSMRDNRLVFMNEESLTKFNSFKSKDFKIK